MEFSESENEILSAVFSPFTLGKLVLRNRIIRAACFSGMCDEGIPSEKFIQFHANLAKGGVGMTTVSYASVSKNGRGFENELWMRPEISPQLKQLTERVHDYGAAISIQLNHCGYFSEPKAIEGRPIGASANFCMFRFSLCKKMTHEDIKQTTQDFAAAALQAKETGFDCIELHAGHGYLLTQFLSRSTNFRKDKYGGKKLSNRLRFPLEVVQAIRDAVGPDFPIVVKMNLNDMVFRRGNGLKEAIQIAKAFERDGVDALIPSCGFTSGSSALNMLRGGMPLTEMMENEKSFVTRMFLKNYGGMLIRVKPFNKLFLLKEGSQTIANAVNIPVIYVGGVTDLKGMGDLLSKGFPLFQIGRALVRDTDFPNLLQSKKLKTSNCDHCNRCVATAEREGLECYTVLDEERRKKMSPKQLQMDDKMLYRRKYPIMWLNIAILALIILFIIWIIIM